MSQQERILPTSISKYPGHIWQSGNRYRVAFKPIDSTTKRETRRFETYEEASNYLQFRSECENYSRVKNIIYRHSSNDDNHYYSVQLSNGKVMLFEEIDLDLVQSRIWFYNNKGYTQCSKPVNDTVLPSTLFHVCMMGGPAEKGHEYIHLNGERCDNRHRNVHKEKKTRKIR